MNTMTTPTPPAGYKLVKGEDIKDRVPEGAKVATRSQEWTDSWFVGQKLDALLWKECYAIPETKPEPVIPEIGPQPPNGYVLKHRSEILEELPVGSMAWCPVFKKWVKDVFGDVKHHSSDREWYAIKNEKSSILEEAKSIVAGDRAKDYGDVNESFTRIAAFWTAWKGVEFTPWDVAQMMILLKVSRAKTSRKRDTLVDIVGYAECAEGLE